MGSNYVHGATVLIFQFWCWCHRNFSCTSCCMYINVYTTLLQRLLHARPGSFSWTRGYVYTSMERFCKGESLPSEGEVHWISPNPGSHPIDWRLPSITITIIKLSWRFLRNEHRSSPRTNHTGCPVAFPENRSMNGQHWGRQSGHRQPQERLLRHLEA